MHWMASTGADADDEYEKLIIRMNPPRVSVDASACEKYTVVKVESANKHGILLEVVQALTDLDLSIHKAYISSDGEWFMDVFYVTDKNGNKLTDEGIVEYLQKAVGAHVWQVKEKAEEENQAYTSIELTGSDRPGLLSEIFAVLTELRCNVVAAQVWTNNARVAAVLHITDADGGPLGDSERLSRMQRLLGNVLSHSHLQLHRHGRCHESSSTAISSAATHPDRRLHQMMYAARDYERHHRGRNVYEDLQEEEEEEQEEDSSSSSSASSSKSKVNVSVHDCDDKGYSVVSVKCRDRPKLVFDTVCTLTDMQYVVFHATVHTHSSLAFQEYYMRHVDGFPVRSEAERRRIIQCIEAAIQRRASEGLRLELCSGDRVGLLSDVTRIFRENGLSVRRAEVRTVAGKALDVFYVTDTQGNPVTSNAVVDAVRAEIGHAVVRVGTAAGDANSGGEGTRFSIGRLFRSKSEKLLYNLGLLKQQQ